MEVNPTSDFVWQEFPNATLYEVAVTTNVGTETFQTPDLFLPAITALDGKAEGSYTAKIRAKIGSYWTQFTDPPLAFDWVTTIPGTVEGFGVA